MTSSPESTGPLASYVSQFEQVVAKHADKVAITDSIGGAVRYGELNARANALAAHMTETAAVRAGDIVAILAGRSIELATTILAVWKCRAAYVLLDPLLSDTRINDLIQIATPARLLTTRQFIEARKLTVDPGKIMDLDAVVPRLAGSGSRNLHLAYAPRDLSYVFFTSGSTGRPKGALIEQIGAVNHMHAKLFSTRMSEHSVMAQTASLNFNIFNWQTFGPLLTGASVVIYDDTIARSPLLLAERVCRDGVDYLQIVPSLFSLLLDVVRATPALLSSLSMLLLTGEKPKTQDINNWFELYPDIPILNSYGCTEAADDSVHHVLRSRLGASEHVPVGVAIQNTTIHIVKRDAAGALVCEESGRPVLCGPDEVGEIWISGDIAVGLGYVNNDAETARYFSTDPFTGQRLFKIGDLGYRNSDGDIVCLGRADRQVKINGQRLDLAEIEAQILSSAPDIRDVVVMTHTTPGGRQFLTAIFRAQREYGIRELRGFKGILVHLPVHLIPHFWIQVDEMPTLSGSGKVDRQKLKARQEDAFRNPGTTSPLRDRQELPRSDEEKLLAKIWWEVLRLGELGIEQSSVGINECFFNLGGDSLTAQQLGAALQAAGYELDYENFYKASAIKERALYLKRR